MLKVTHTLGTLYNYDLTPEGADYLPNYLVLDQINSSLFKVDLSGKPEPYAVESWKSDETNLNWIFKIKKDQFTHNGTKILPSTWCEGIIAATKRVKSLEKMILLSKLIGWENFVKGTGQFPVECNDSNLSLKFKFKDKPEGIIEFLTMPILGFWSFDPQGGVIPTGPYKIVSQSPGKIELAASDKLITLPKSKRVTISSINPEECKEYNLSENEILIPTRACEVTPSRFSVIKSTPSMLSFVELNVLKPVFKNNIELRKSVFNTIIDTKNNISLNPDSEFKASSVFYDFPSKIKKESDESAKIKINEKLKIITNGSNTTKLNPKTEKIINSIKQKHQCEIDLNIISDSQEFIKTLHSRDYDIRIGSVDAGTHPSKWVTEMMFCTKQGISFIDPNNDICKGLQVLSENDSAKIASVIEDSINKHLQIIPLFNISIVVYAGKNIDPNSIAANTPSIRLELVDFK